MMDLSSSNVAATRHEAARNRRAARVWSVSSLVAGLLSLGLSFHETASILVGAFVSAPPVRHGAAIARSSLVVAIAFLAASAVLGFRGRETRLRSVWWLVVTMLALLAAASFAATVFTL